MSARIGWVLGLILAVSALPASGRAQMPAVQCVPEDALICLHIARPTVLLDQLADDEMVQAIRSLSLYQQQTSDPGFQEFLNVVQFLETSLDTDWRSGLAQLTGGGITLAVCPDETVLAVVDSQDEHLLGRLHEIFVNIARSEAQKAGTSEKVTSREYGDATVWSFDGREAHAVIGQRFIFANRFERLQVALDQQASKGKTSLADNSAYQVARRAAGSDAVATAFVNLKPLVGLPPVTEALDKSRKNPLAALLLAGISESLRDSNWLALRLDVKDRTLALRALVDGQVAGPPNPAAFAVPQNAGAGARPSLSVPRRIAALSLYRDLHGFYAAKDKLFPERTSGLIFFENMMGIFFTGRDLTSEVLAEAEPGIQIVVAEQRFDPAEGTPAVKLPAFAAILRLRRPQQFGSVVEEAWQKAIGLINFTRGQQALPGLIIDRPSHGQIKYTLAYFSAGEAADKEKLDTRFNVRPTLALPGDYLVLSSTDGLARDLIDALSQAGGEDVAPLARTDSLLEISGKRVASILASNRQTLVRQDMVKKGKTKEEAEAGVDMLVTLLTCVDHVKLSIGRQNDLTQADLSMRLGLPKP